MTALTVLRTWSTRHWMAAVVGGASVALAVGLPTDVIPNPVFGRPIPVTWWSYPVLAVTAALGGLLLATYVRGEGGGPLEFEETLDPHAERQAKTGGMAGLLSFFAVGCPICNKVVVIALGTSGALSWFAPVQPYLGVIALGLLTWALRARLRGEVACPVEAA